MPITAIDPNTALIVVDLQAAATRMPTVHPFGAVLANAVRLADAFRVRQLPVVLVNVAGGAPGRTEHGFRAHHLPAGWSDLLPEPKLGETGTTAEVLSHLGDYASSARDLGMAADERCG